jgi:hypothetical protein
MVSENHGSEVFDDFVSLVMSQSYCSSPLLQVYMSLSFNFALKVYALDRSCIFRLRGHRRLALLSPIARAPFYAKLHCARFFLCDPSNINKTLATSIPGGGGRFCTSASICISQKLLRIPIQGRWTQIIAVSVRSSFMVTTTIQNT